MNPVACLNLATVLKIFVGGKPGNMLAHHNAATQGIYLTGIYLTVFAAISCDANTCPTLKATLQLRHDVNRFRVCFC
jgi:hypothetical protein